VRRLSGAAPASARGAYPDIPRPRPDFGLTSLSNRQGGVVSGHCVGQHATMSRIVPDLASDAPVCSLMDDVWTLGFKDQGSDKYILIQWPDGGPEEFFGTDHYVEVSDQIGGRYGGISGISLSTDHLEISLNYASPLGSILRVSFPPESREELEAALRRSPLQSRIEIKSER
jgi:hypothetical protein